MILATFIIGLALGSLIFGWLADKIKKPLVLLISTQLGAAFLALGISQLLGNSQFLFAKLIDQFNAQFAQLEVLKASILFCLMLGPTLCLGATFPLVGKIYTQSLTRVGRSIGFAYAINTLGAVLGSFCAGFLLIPFFGKEQSLSGVIGFQLLTSLLIAGYILWEKKASIVRWIPLGVTALLGLILCSHFPYWNRELLSMGRYHRFGDLSSELSSRGWLEALWLGPEILAGHQSNFELLYYGDGIGGFTTVVKETDALATPEYILVNSGKPDASSRGDMPTQTLLAHIPLLFHSNPKEIMVLGLASGVTGGEVLHYPVERLDIIEISQQVVSASNFFAPWNNQVLLNPKTELIIQDGRAHLELTERTYNPWMAGLASLFTRDFFLLAKDRLNEGGIFVQWVHVYQMDWPTFSLIGRTFCQVFPQSLLMSTSPSGGDYLLIGFKGGTRLQVNHAEKNISYVQQSKNITLPNPKLLYRLIVSENLQELFGPGPVHSDNLPHLEYAAPKQMYSDDSSIKKNIRSKKWLSQETRAILQETANLEGQIDFATYALSVYNPFHNMVDLLKATPQQKGRFFEIVEDYCSRALIKDYSIFTDQALKERCLATQIETIKNNLDLVPDKTVVYNHLGNAYDAKGEFWLAIESYQNALAINPDSAETHNNLGVAYRIVGKVDEAISEYQNALATDPNFAGAYNNLGYAYFKKGRFDEAISEHKKAITIKPNFAEAHNNLGNAYFKKGRLDEAIVFYKNAITIKPNFAMAHQNLGLAYNKNGRLDEAIAEFEKAVAINPNYVKAYYNLGNIYYRKGRLDQAISEYKKALAIEPSNAKILNNLKHAYAKKKQGR